MESPDQSPAIHDRPTQQCLFGARDVIAATIEASNAEGCPLYNMLKLSRSLFFHDPDPKYMQYFERGLYGQIISRRQDAHSQTNPLVTYFLPVDPGAVRAYAGNLGDCDGGTGPEDATKFQESIYFRSVDGSALYVNLYTASVLNWPARPRRTGRPSLRTWPAR